jgi:hypothetical protein
LADRKSKTLKFPTTHYTIFQPIKNPLLKPF